MAREAVHKKKIVFTVQKNGGEQVAPRWKEAIVQNVTCRNCPQMMTVIITGEEQPWLNAHCTRCQEYFIGD